jgi:hypothetical protein
LRSLLVHGTHFLRNVYLFAILAFESSWFLASWLLLWPVR